MSILGRVLQWFADPAHWTGSDGIPTRLVQHVQLSAESVLIGAVIALPVGIVLGHYGRFGNLAINVSNVGRAVPSFALLVLAFQVFGLGDAPIIISLTALAIPPMVTNSYVAMQEVDPDVKDAARGMGYRELAQVLRVELPLAVPLLMAGIRLALTAVACGSSPSSSSTTPKGTITVAGFKFSEGSVLAELYGQALQHDGYTVNFKLNLGSREVVAPAIKSSQVDLYIGYA